MPLFFVISGYLFIYSMTKKEWNVKFIDFLIKKCKRLIIPYITIGTIAFLLKAFIFNSFAYRPTTPSFTYYLKSMIYPSSNPNLYLWFLPTILIIFVLSYSIFMKSKKYIPLLIITAIISFFSRYTHFSILNISGVLYYLFYFILGITIYEYRDKLFPFLTSKIFITINFLIFSLLFISPYKDLFNMPLAMCGVLLSFSLAFICTSKNIKFLGGIFDEYYYQIYLLSWFAQTGLRIFYQLKLINYITACIIMFIGAFIFSFIITELIKKFIPKLKVFIGL